MTEDEIALTLLRYPFPSGVFLHETLHRSLFRVFGHEGKPTQELVFYLQDHPNPFQGGKIFGVFITESVTQEGILSIAYNAAVAFLNLKKEHPVHED